MTRIAWCGTCGDAPADGPDGNCATCRGEWAIRNEPDVWPEDDMLALPSRSLGLECKSEAVIGANGVCPTCGQVVFAHMWAAWKRRLAKPAANWGLLPVGIKRNARR